MISFPWLVHDVLCDNINNNKPNAKIKRKTMGKNPRVILICNDELVYT
jgi:hypothetical protein